MLFSEPIGNFMSMCIQIQKDYTIVFVDTISNVSCSEHLTRRFGDMIRYLPSGSIRQIQTFAQLLSESTET